MKVRSEDIFLEKVDAEKGLVIIKVAVGMCVLLNFSLIWS